MPPKRRADDDGGRNAASDTTRSSKQQRRHAPASNRSDSGRSFGSNMSSLLATIYHSRDCWVCGAHELIQRAHVFPKKDDSLAALVDKALLGLHSHADVDNAIHLCSACHAAWDHVYNPMLLIAPTYLDFFLAAEQQWQAACQADPATARMRLPPTRDAYLDYCVAQDGRRDGIPDHGRGGLYTVHVVKNYFPFPDKLDLWTWHSHWHGDPSAMVRRALIATPKITSTDSRLASTLLQLQELSILYLKGDNMWRAIDEQNQAVLLPPPGPPPPNPPSSSKKDAGPPPDTPPTPNNPPKDMSQPMAPPPSPFPPPVARGHPHRLPSPPLSAPQSRKRRREADSEPEPTTQAKHIRHNNSVEDKDTEAGWALDAGTASHYLRRWLGLLEEPTVPCLSRTCDVSTVKSGNDSLSVHTAHASGEREPHTAEDRKWKQWRYGPGSSATETMRRWALFYVDHRHAAADPG